MFLLNMFLIIHFLLVFSLIDPFPDIWKAVSLKKGLFIPQYDESHNTELINVECNVFSTRNQKPSVTTKYHSYEAISKSRRVKLHSKKKFYLRRAACLGKNGEIIEVLCCTDNHPKPWIIFLPMKHITHCYRPDCQHTCYMAIVEYRKKKYSMTENLNNGTFPKYNNYYEGYEEREENNNVEVSSIKSEFEKSILAPTKSSNIYSKSKTTKNTIFHNDIRSNCSPTVLIPEVILELLDLCNYLNNSNFFQFKRLSSLCKMKNMNLNEFLNHLNYINNTRETENISLNGEADNFGNDSDEIFFHEIINKTEPKIPSKFKSDERECDFYTMNRRNNISNKNQLNSFEEIIFPLKRQFKNAQLPAAMRYSTLSFFNDSKDDLKTITSISTLMSNTGNSEFKGNCCCTCTKSRMFIVKEKLKSLLMVLLRGPIPTFVNKTNLVTHSIGKTDLKMVLPPPTTAQSEIIISDVPSYTLLEADRSAEKITLVESYKPGDSIEKYVDYLNDRCAAMYRTYKNAQWEYETNITLNTKQRLMVTSSEFNHLLQRVNKELSVLKDEPIKETKLRRQIKLLFMQGMNSLPELKSNEFDQVLYAMETIYSSAMVSKWKHQSDKVYLNPIIKNVMANSMDPEELKYYWIEWRKATGKRIKSLFEHYVSLMSLAAETNGFNDASEMWTRHYECEDFIDMLGIYWEGVKPLYIELHAYIRHKLHSLYGEVAGATDKGKIPAHLTGDIWSQNWKNLYRKVIPFNLRDDGMDKEFKNEVRSEKICKKIEKSFVSMGFAELPKEFWKNSIFFKVNNTVMSCEPSAWDMGNGMDYRIKLCAIPNMQDLFHIHHLITLIEYYKEYKGLPYAFRNGANPGFPGAVAGAVVLSAHTQKNLKQFGIINKHSEKSTINKLMRIALEKVAFLPYSYILILWRNKVFNGEINITNYNSEWWKMRSKYQGISPPIERTEDDFDVGSKQHIVANQPYIKYFVSTILQFQFFEALCKKTNYQGALHECDISSEVVGNTLRNVMSMGSSCHWKVAMQELTGTHKIDTKPIMRYFEPLFNWLRKNNKEGKIKVGWEDYKNE